VSVGVDVASQPAGTAACRVRWERSGAVIESVEHELDDRRLAAILAEPAAAIGLDVPLGWPDGFVEAVARYHAGGPFGEAGIGRLARRQTDQWVRDTIHQTPLSVSTDRIAYPAMRVARLVGGALPAGFDRTGAGTLVEVYPAAALRVWELPHRGYKGPANRAALLVIAQQLRDRCPWLSAGRSTWDEASRSDHEFDALLCALVARAHQLGLCHPIPLDLRDAAVREGWIAVPLPASLQALVGAAARPG
jgi:hypothetical protein